MIEMDPESNWDICPVCLEDAEGLRHIGIEITNELIRARHSAHKAAKKASGPDSQPCPGPCHYDHREDGRQ